MFETTVTIILNEIVMIVLDVLALRTRVATEEQLGRIVAARCAGKPSIRTVMKRLKSAGLVNGRLISAAFIESIVPLVEVDFHDFPLDFQTIARRLAERWRNVRSRRVTVWWATERATNFLGGAASLPRHATQIEHDLGTTSILARLHETQPDAVAQWVGEDILRRDYAPMCRCFSKVPDAALIRDDVVLKFIEFGGQYSADRIRKFDQHCQKHRLPYSLW